MRPRNKTDLQVAAAEGYKKLMDFIDSMTPAELSTPFDFSGDLKKTEAHWSRDKNLKDVLIHLYEWHELMIDFAEGIRTGNEKQFLPERYSWRTYGEMNLGFWSKHLKTTLDDAISQLEETHQKVMDLIDLFSDEELFTKRHYKCCGTTDLGSYFVSTTSSHYDWALKKLKFHRKNVNK